MGKLSEQAAPEKVYPPCYQPDPDHVTDHTPATFSGA